MTDKTSMIADFASRQEERHERSKLKLDHLKAVTLVALRANEITNVQITFDGCGDSGSIDDITYHSADGNVADCPNVKVAAPNGRESEPEATRAIPLTEALEDIGYLALELHHPGWEINEGSAGALEIAVAQGSFTLECRARFIDTMSVSPRSEEENHGPLLLPCTLLGPENGAEWPRIISICTSGSTNRKAYSPICVTAPFGTMPKGYSCSKTCLVRPL